MKIVSIRFPDGIHKSLRTYKQTEKPHMSLNSIVIEAVQEQLSKKETEINGRTQDTNRL